MSKKPNITDIIKGAMSRSGYNMKSLSEATGINYDTLRLNRFPDPGSWRFFEWGSLKRKITFTPEEIRMIEEQI